VDGLRDYFKHRGIHAYWSNHDQEIVFRDPRGPACTFYPSTGRWLLVGGKASISGGAEAFLRWYQKRFHE
jgi:hypothetical protein